jgi:hypothetical protein
LANCWRRWWSAEQSIRSRRACVNESLAGVAPAGTTAQYYMNSFLYWKLLLVIISIKKFWPSWSRVFLCCAAVPTLASWLAKELLVVA